MPTLPSRARSFLLYFAGALGGLAIDWAVWSALVWSGLSPVSGQAAGKAAGAVFAFLAYRNGAFSDAPRDRVPGQAARFAAAAGLGWLAGVALIAVALLALPPVAAKFASDGVTFVMNWFIMRHWVFPRRA